MYEEGLVRSLGVNLLKIQWILTLASKTPFFRIIFQVSNFGEDELLSLLRTFSVKPSVVQR